jgi:Leucine-rich repeat (LRR) protein
MRKLITLSLLTILVSCGKPKSSEMQSQHEFNGQGEQVSYLGAGFETFTEQVKSNECMKSTAPMVTDSHLDEASMEVLIDNSAESLREFLYGYGKVGIPVFPAINVTIEADLTRDHIKDKFSDVMTLAYRASGIEESLDFEHLAVGEDARRVLAGLASSNLSNAEKAQIFAKACGDKFVMKVQKGIVFLASIRMRFDSEHSMNQLRGTLSVELGNLAKPLKALEKLAPPPRLTIGGKTRNSYQHVTLEVTVYQRGGTPEDALTVLGNNDGSDQGTTVVSCDFDNREYCYGAFLRLHEYASKQLPSQLGNIKNLAPLSYIAEQYYADEIAAVLKERPSQADPLQFKAFLTRIRQDQSQLDEDYSQLKQVEVALPSLYLENIDRFEEVSDPQELLRNLGVSWLQNQIIRKKIAQAKDVITLLQSLYKDLEEECVRTSDLPTCEQELSSIQSRRAKGDLYYDQKAIQLPPKSFSVFCQLYFKDGGLTDEERLTVETIIDRALEPLDEAIVKYNDFAGKKGLSALSYSKEDWSFLQEFEVANICTGLEVYINHIKKLDLSNSGISNLEPLRGLDELESLNLSSNSLQSQELLKLALLPKLKSLNVSYNFIEDLAIFTSLNSKVELPLPNSEDTSQPTTPAASPEVKDSCVERELILDQNGIEALEALASPDWAWGSVSLKRNRINAIPGIRLGACLKKLDLGRNPIRSVSENFEFPQENFEIILKGSLLSQCPFPSDAQRGLICSL